MCEEHRGDDKGLGPSAEGLLQQPGELALSASRRPPQVSKQAF